MFHLKEGPNVPSTVRIPVSSAGLRRSRFHPHATSVSGTAQAPTTPKKDTSPPATIAPSTPP